MTVATVLAGAWHKHFSAIRCCDLGLSALSRPMAAALAAGALAAVLCIQQGELVIR